MEKQLKCVLLLSLREMTLRSVAVLLWSGSDVLASISKIQYFALISKRCKKEWRETIEGKIKDKMSTLGLPKSLEEQMIEVVQLIGTELRRWKLIHQRFFSSAREENCLPYSAKLCFTTAGMIDYGRTAEELVLCDKLRVVQRYAIACEYSLKDYIPLLWEELPEEKKDFFYNDALYEKTTLPYLLSCWPHILKGELSTLDYLLRTSDRNLNTFNQWAFERSVKCGYKTSAQYFFQKLANEEREASLMRSAHAVLGPTYPDGLLMERKSDLLCYLLSLMTPEQQMELVKAHPVHVLLCFLDWPLHDLFLKNAGLIWTFLPPSSYGDLLRKMAEKCEDSYHYSHKLFQEFFKQGPLDFKKYFVNEESESGSTPAYRFLSIYFRSGSSESIKVIFRNLDAADRVTLVFHRRVLRLFYKSILRDRWHMVEVCLREATLSKGDRKSLKKAFMKYLKSIDTGHIVLGNPIWKRFFEFLDETDASADKVKKV